MSTARNLIRMSVSNDPGLLGSIVGGAAASGYLALGAGDDGLPFDLTIYQPGVGREIRKDCIYTHNTTTWTRGTLAASSTGAAISLTSAAIVEVVLEASRLLSVPVVVGDAAAATANAVNIQAALNTQHKAHITTAGTVYINKTILMGSGDSLALGAGVLVKLAPNSDCNLVRNRDAGVVIYNTAVVRASNVVTVSEPGHSRAVNDEVLVSNFSVDTSFNGLHTVASVAADSWTYASTGSDGSPSSYGYFNPANNQLAAANFVSSSNVVTVTEAGHTRQPGDAVFVANLATNTSFNGTWQVVTVTYTAGVGVSWTYVKTGADTSPTGYGVVLGENYISILGPGRFEVDYPNQSSAAAYQTAGAVRGISLGNVSKVRVGDGLRFANAWGYCLWMFNSSDVLVDGCYSDGTKGDVVHFEAPGDRIKVANVYGSSGDDMVAFTNVNPALGGSYLGLASPSGVGNFGALELDNIVPSNSSAPAVIKYASCTGYGCKSLRIKRLGGTMSGAGLSGVALVDDSASLTGGSLDYLEIDGFTLTGGYASSRMLLITQTGGIKKVKLSNIQWPSTWLASQLLLAESAITINEFHLADSSLDVLLSSGKDVLLLSAALTISDLHISNCNFNGNSGGGNVVTQQNGATVSRLYITDVVANALNSFWRQNGSGTTNEIYATNLRGLANANVFTNVSNVTINCVNCKFTSTANNDFQVGGGTVRIVGKNLQTTAAGDTVLLNYNSSSVSYSCPDKEAGIDLGANGGSPPAGLVPIAGDQIYNTNGTGAGLYGYTAAGAWSSIF